ncbi:hypothetical protein [Pyrococcus kukulkanii]|uniref:Uncharacterized protein n=1 Tax=Pyrococcus kukulkanii TaxID=1609559 RepID=A0A127B8K0_9EURY|nr:hypothetical protein [Pyrococcus kukulkanii]AMM53507.1 hypothetical protein TQ32_02635 [Pyrococcus kukulkanii]
MPVYVVEANEVWLVEAEDAMEAIDAYLMKKLAEALLEGRDAEIGGEVTATLLPLHPHHLRLMYENIGRVEKAKDVMRWARRVWEEKRREFLMKKQEKQLTLAEVGVV